MKKIILLLGLISIANLGVAQDVWLQGHFLPNSGTGLSNAETVTVLVNNNSAVIIPANTIQVSYSVNNGTPVNQYLNANLTGGASWNFSFSTKVNLSDFGLYKLKVWVTRAGDSNHLNDTVVWNVINSCERLYVNKHVSGGTQRGDSWANAIPELADALKIAKNLNTAVPGMLKDIWVATGTYKPLYSPEDGANFGTDKAQNNAFLLVKDVKLYGGFPDSGTPAFGDRDIQTNATILSGNLNNNNTSDGGDNYHVLIGAGDVGTALLDGFTITSGFSGGASSITVNAKGVPRTDGGGIVLNESSPVINNCVFRDNVSGTHGGAMSNLNSSPQISNCIFNANESQSGGAMYNYAGSSPQVFNCLFTANVANYGSDMQNYDGNTTLETSPVIYNCTFYNEATNSKIYNDGEHVKPNIYNSILWGGNAQIENVNSWDSVNGLASPTVSHSIIKGGYAGEGNIATDPLFVSVTTPDFSIQDNSPAINAGDNSLFIDLDASTTDLAGNLRVYKYASAGVIDMGVYEYQGDAPLPVSLLTFSAKADGNRVQLYWQTASEQNNRKFIVYRSGDDGNFIRIGEKEGAGTTTATSNYIFYDAAPLYGNNYYKLVQTDVNDKQTELGVRVVTFNFQPLTFNLYPNPTTGSIHTNFEKGKYNNVILMDMTGRILTEQAMDHEAQSAAVNLSGYPAGNYLLTFIGKGAKVTEKVVKK